MHFFFIFLQSLTYAYIYENNITDYYSNLIRKPLNFLCESGRLLLDNGSGHYTYQLFLKEHYMDYNQFKSNDLLWIILKYDGCSSIIDAYNNYGPFQYENNKINLHPNSYNKIANILYIDQPFGVGYSDGKGDLSECALYIVKFLKEFLNKKGMNNLKLYLYGKEIAAWILPKIIDLSPYYHLNFSGIILDSGWVSPIHQIGFYGSFLYQLGIVDSKKRDDIYYNQTSLQVQLLNQNLTNATQINDMIQKMQEVLKRLNNNNQTFLDNEIMNYISENAETLYGLSYMNITSCNETLNQQLKEFYQNSSLQEIELLLSKEKDIIIIANQFDVKITAPGIVYWLNSLKWTNIMKWRQQQKELVYDIIEDKQMNITKKVTVGYIKQFTRLKYIVAYNEKYKLLKQIFIDY